MYAEQGAVSRRFRQIYIVSIFSNHLDLHIIWADFSYSYLTHIHLYTYVNIWMSWWKCSCDLVGIYSEIAPNFCIVLHLLIRIKLYLWINMGKWRYYFKHHIKWQIYALNTNKPRNSMIYELNTIGLNFSTLRLFSYK